MYGGGGMVDGRWQISDESVRLHALVRMLDVGTRSSFGMCSSQVLCSARLELQNWAWCLVFLICMLIGMWRNAMGDLEQVARAWCLKSLLSAERAEKGRTGKKRPRTREATASSLACSHPPPATRVRVATPVLTSRTATSSTPSPRIPDAVFTPVRGERTGMSTSGVSSLGFVWGYTCWLCYFHTSEGIRHGDAKCPKATCISRNERAGATRWPPREKKKRERNTANPIRLHDLETNFLALSHK